MADRVRLPRLLQKALQSDGNTLKEKARLHPLSMSVELNLYPLSRATMTLPETDAAVQMHDLVEIFGQNGSFGIFRVVNIATTYKRQRQVQLNHALDVFSDALLPGEMTATGTVAQVLAQFVAGQTANIGGSPYWALGTCEDTNAYSADIKYTNLMQCLTNLAKAEEDYYFTFDFSRFPWRLNFIARNDTVLSEFRLPRNVESCQVSFDNSDMCTRLYLSVDTTTTSQDGSTTVTTHETHNDTAAQALYGIVSKTAGIKAEQVPDKAAWVQRYFARHAQPGVQISISGREINRLSGETLDEMHLGRICRIALPEYSTTFNERIIAVKYPDVLRDPERVDVSLANKKQSAEGSFAGLTSRTSATESASKETQKELQNTKTSTTTKWRVTDQHVTDQGTILHAAGLEIDAHGVWLYASEHGADYALGASFKVQSDAITAEVARASSAEGVIGSSITQTAESIRSEVHASESTIYSSITQTAESIRSEVHSTASQLGSSITQTATSIRAEVHAADSKLSSSITQTAESIRSEVHATASQLSSSITQTADQIALKVSKGDVSTQLAVECGNVTISGGDLIVSGYIKSDQLATLIANIATLKVGNVQATGNISASGGVTATGLYISSGSSNKSVANAISGIGVATSSSGSIYIPTTKLDGTQGPPITFNIADTQFYQDAVASAEAAGKASIHLSSSWNNNNDRLTIGKTTSGNTNSMSFLIGVNAPTVIYNSTTHQYTATAQATVDGTVRGDAASAYSGTDAYDDGFTKADGQYSSASYARKNLNRYGHAELYVKERETYYSAGNHYWYWSGSDGWDALYTKSSS